MTTQDSIVLQEILKTLKKINARIDIIALNVAKKSIEPDVHNGYYDIIREEHYSEHKEED